jgi:hypothetical protein
MSDGIYLHTERGVKKLNVSAESWPRSTSWLLLRNYDTILKIAIKDHGSGEMYEDVYTHALVVWAGGVFSLRRLCHERVRRHR